ncbi:hypothetical protein DAPPUDRAFT_111202 [Daphnia pulex]|uniref:Uncharacterized protein n=1 Tax=Daphnia pulex TaxID=6669 RepID=E9H8I8_DAPPU|nr:hypothetical protein DAPPUDRAFT_111202 [Daphnia pulex]|eukprot:EFX71953.1 hypothetical protein DAPPUDRAFT_111202 [Daphnia pulex]
MSGFSGRYRDYWVDTRVANFEREQQERDLVQRSRLRERDCYESRFQERERSPLHSAPSDFYQDQAIFPAVPPHVHFEGYGRVGPDYVLDQRDFHSSRNPRYGGRPSYEQRRVNPLADQGGRSRYGDVVPRREKSERPSIPDQVDEDIYGDEEQPENEEVLDELILDDLDDHDRLQKFYNRPWRPSSSKSEEPPEPPPAVKSKRSSAAMPVSVSPKPGPLKERTPEPSEKAEPAPLIVPQEVSDALSGWLMKGVSTEDSKAISKKTPLEFLDKEFSVKPPKLDGDMHRRAKDKGKLKAIMDVGPPLIDLYTRILSLGEGKTEKKAQELVQDALRQWARAYHHITKQRRRAVIALVEPSFDFLTAEPEAFAPGKEARELLFTGKFLESRGVESLKKQHRTRHWWERQNPRRVLDREERRLRTHLSRCRAIHSFCGRERRRSSRTEAEVSEGDQQVPTHGREVFRAVRRRGGGQIVGLCGPMV